VVLFGAEQNPLVDRSGLAIVRSPNQAADSQATGLVSVPIFSISILTLSPGLSQRGGFCAMPTPCGVTVRITVPGKSVVLPQRNSITPAHRKSCRSYSNPA
jgi:hypothetical protein